VVEPPRLDQVVEDRGKLRLTRADHPAAALIEADLVAAFVGRPAPALDRLAGGVGEVGRLLPRYAMPREIGAPQAGTLNSSYRSAARSAGRTR
jgi:hypothetical protein